MEGGRAPPARRPADMAELSRRLEIILHVMRKEQREAQAQAQGSPTGVRRNLMTA